MPIKGLTTDEAAFPRIGVLRKGGPKPDAKRIGPDLTHFRFTSEYDDVVAKFYAVFGDEPTDIPIYLPYRTREQNFENWREHWVAGGLKHRCDGETCVVWQDKGGTYHNDPKPCPGGCKPVGRLTIIIPQFERLAYVTALTTSLHDILELNRNLAALELGLGDLRGIPLVLRRRPRMVSTPGGSDGKRVRREKWLLTIEADENWTKAQLAAQRKAAFLQLTAAPAGELTAPDDENGWESTGVDPATGEILGDWPEEEDIEEGEFVEAAQEEAPEQETGTPDTPTITSPKELLTAINATTGGAYDGLPAMLKVLRKVYGDAKWNWPNASEPDAYRACYNILLDDYEASKA